ncbi:uncharacterized protein LOC143021003 isoform X3 [Oratosquilla oratoria]|uniref:uncharacterized protein LOC143021003 isoform X3 n=1 Tax=Oratosquilla oratoria TaxID=337810 RepID=UPI003F76E9F8
MILDQFLSSLHPDLRPFKERRPSTLTEAIRLADDWTSAQPTLPRTSVLNAKKFSRLPKVTTVLPNSSIGRKDPPPLTCHGCGEIGHIRPRCPRNPGTLKEGTSATQLYKLMTPLCHARHKLLHPLPSIWYETLSAARAKAASGEIDQMKNGSTYQFVKMDGLLYRKCLTSKRPDKVGKSTLVVPRDCCPIILSIAHESPLAGHFSHRKTELKVTEQFY